MPKLKLPKKISVKKTKKVNPSSKSFLPEKKFFDETIEILDSDDDFVIPSAALRGRSKEKVDNVSIEIMSTSAGSSRMLEVSKNHEKVDKDSTTYEPVSLSKLIENVRRKRERCITKDRDRDLDLDLDLGCDRDPEPERALWETVAEEGPAVVELDGECEEYSTFVGAFPVLETSGVGSSASVARFEDFIATQQVGRVETVVEDLTFVTEAEEIDITQETGWSNSSLDKPNDKEAWKSLMQRMQIHQSSSQSMSGRSRTNAGGKRGNKVKIVDSFIKTKPSGASQKNSLQPNLSATVTSTVLCSRTALSTSPEKEESTSYHSPPKSTSTITSSSVNQPSRKIPDIFLKPEERAALALREKGEKTKIQVNSGFILSALSEPTVYNSVKDNPDHFDGNVVKINTYAPDHDPYGGMKKKTCPFYKKLPGTRFSVDAFNFGAIPGISVYFLSHFHSDHYIGLTKKFYSTVICSPPTANLVSMKLYVEEKCIRRLQLNRPYMIEGVEVVLVDANHCPGSVMFIFRLPNGITYLHTGDFRFTTDMLENHYLQGIRVDCLYLDTTYCDPKYDFPTQADSIIELIAVIKRRLEFRPKTLILCGSYLIGKERVYFSLAEAFGSKVFAQYDKKRVIHALENSRFSAYLVNNEESADIHVTQMFNIIPKFLSEYLAQRTNRYTHIIGIKPSGWQFSYSGNGTSIKTHYNDTVTVIGVPYSEHSSFSELSSFVQAIKPRKVQPTVNVGSAAKRGSMTEFIDRWLQT